jgi:ribosome biogenesis GTPase A
MVHFWKVVNEVLKLSDIILEVVDARFPDKGRNDEIEGKLKSMKKIFILVLNKSDLLSIDERKPQNVKYYVYVSALKNLGTTKLRGMIKRLSGKKITNIGVVGYPNAGKSSLINVLRQKRVAGTSSMPGFTKGVQKIKLSNGLYLLDTPGVYEYREKDEEKLSFIGAKSADKIKDPEYVAMKILSEAKPNEIENAYGVNYNEDINEFIEEIAIKLNYYKKGKKPDVDRVSRKIIRDWQQGKFQKTI